jgi:hypothetical protein
MPLPSAFLSRKSKAFWSIGIVLLVSLIAALVFWLLDREPDEFLAAVSLNYSTIPLEKVGCLSIDPHKVVFDGKDYSDPKLVESILDILSIRTVLSDADYATCPWGFFATAVPKTIFAVRYGILPANYLVSVGICERTPDGRMDPNRCINKNVYIFNWRVQPHELFSIGLMGLKRPQASKWEVFQSSRLR